MDADRAVLETVARSVSLVVYYRNCGRTTRAREVMEADAANVASLIAGFRLTPEAVGRRILYPLLSQLLDRYPSAEAMDLYEEFVMALWPPKSLRSPSDEPLVYQV